MRCRCLGKPRARRLAAALAASALLAAPVAHADAGSQRDVAIGRTTLDLALSQIARQTGVDIISTESGLRAVSVEGVHGRMATRDALAKLLDGTGYRAVAVSEGGYRIVRAPIVRQHQKPRLTGAPPPSELVQADIIVTASKQQVKLLRFPGSLVTVFDTRYSASAPAADLDDVARRAPVIQTTALGDGRDKVFIRGIADSSFNGATQSTASLYFGDVQLGFSGPEPSLKLYDMQTVEVMEGPQGTLYGAGAIGGIIRLTPNPVDLGTLSAQAGGGVTATQGSEVGYDVNARLNIPIKRDVIGLRAVVYGIRDGGYIDDLRRQTSNANRANTIGGRLALAAEPGEGWTVEAGLIGQRISAQDAQYATSENTGGLTRRSILAQPFENDLAVGRLVVTKTWDSGLQFTSATGGVRYHSLDTFDASTSATAPRIYRNDEDNVLFTEEARLARSLENGNSWVAGATLLIDRNVQSRALGPVGDPPDIIGVTNVTKLYSGFGEATFALTHAISTTFGVRVTHARTDGSPSSTPRSGSFVEGRSTTRFDPTVALSVLLAPRLALYARGQTGYRTGGLAVATGVGRVADYASDAIRMGEVGLRLERAGDTGLAMTIAVSYARWNDIQADLVDRRGLPYTANIGDARIFGIETNADWEPVPRLHAALAVLYTQNDVTGPLADSSLPQNRRLPDTPPLAGTAGLTYRWPAGAGEFRAGGTVTYVGRSVLGTGDAFDISQGRYAVAGLSGGWRHGRIDLSLTLDNLVNVSANRFAYGNPFMLVQRNQETPLRPRNVRFGVSYDW